jgi:hypothetical protein
VSLVLISIGTGALWGSWAGVLALGLVIWLSLMRR